MSKQDRQPARNVTGIEYKYGLGDTVKALRGLQDSAAYLAEQEKMLEAELSLRIRYDENGKIVSMLNASADIIRIKGNRLTIESDHFNLSEDGTIEATAGVIGGCEIKDGLLKVPVANIDGKLTADNIDTGIFTAKVEQLEERLTGYDDRFTNTETSLSVLSGQIAAKVSQTDFDSLGNRVQATESSLSVLPGQIASKVSQTDFDTLGNRVSGAESAITQLPGQILSTVSATYATNDGLKSANSKIDQLPNQILSTVSATYATKDSLNSYAKTTSIDQLSDRIDLKASQEELDSLGGRVSTAEGQITTMSGQIALKVSQTDFDTLGGRVGEAEGRITTLSNEIGLKVSQSDFDALGDTVNTISGELALKIGNDDSGQIVSMLNAAADVIDIKSNRLKITSDNFSLSQDGTITATAGTFGGFVIGYDDEFNGTPVMRSRNGISGTLSYGDGIWITVEGYIFTVFTVRGIYYVVKSSGVYASDTLAKVSAYREHSFSNMADPFGDSGGSGGTV